MADEDNEDWRHEVPESEQLSESSRISDSHWEDLINQISEPSAMASEMPADEVREVLEEAEGWEPGPAAPMGWRTASPTLVLSLLATIGAVAFLLFGIVFVRPIPGWFVLLGVAVGLGGTVGLYFHLPTHRDLDDGNGASV